MKLNKLNGQTTHTEFENQFHGYQSIEKPTLKYYQITDSEGYKKHTSKEITKHKEKLFLIEGSNTTRDWFDDVSQSHAWGDLKDSERYHKVLEAFTKRGEIDTVVGHSLGGSVALDFQKNYLDRVKNNMTHGAPMLD